MANQDHQQAPVQVRGALGASFPPTAEGLEALDAAIAEGGGGSAGYTAVAEAHGVSVAAVKKHRVRFPAELKQGAIFPPPAKASAIAIEINPSDFIFGASHDASIDVMRWSNADAWFMAPADETIARARVPRDLASPETWMELMNRIYREELHERNPWVEEFLPLCHGLALLPSGENKIPIDPTNGRRLEGWQSHTFTVDEIRELEDPTGAVRCLSYRPGPDSGNIIALDLDGDSASVWFRARDAEPNDAGWRTTRAADRQKAHYRLTDELLHALVEARGEAGLSGKITLTTKEAPPGGKAEQIELFIASGQCVIAGQPSEGPPYKNHGSPQTVTEPDEAMAAALIDLVKAAPKPDPRSGGEHTPGESWQSGPDSPCPVCGRNTTGGCTIWVTDDEVPRLGVNCLIGQRFGPPTEIDMPGFGGKRELERGDVVPGADGGQWVFSRQGQNPSVGTFKTFLQDRAMPTESAPRTGKAPAQGEGTLADRLKRLAAEGLSGSALLLRLKTLADATSSSMWEVERMYEKLVEEQEQAEETAVTFDQLERLNASAGIDVAALIPPELLEALQAMRVFADYRLDVLLAVLMTGLSGALPLQSRIILNDMEDFEQPLSLWALLLMPSGEAKSPLLKRLLADPWRLAVDSVLAEAYEERLAEWEAQQQRQEQGQGRQIPKPRKPQTLVTEDATVQGMETHMEIHDAWANRSMCVWLDEGKRALKEMVDRDGGNGKDSPFGGWLLSRYDGTSARGAKAEQARERNYKSCRLSMVTCCQPDVYRTITGDGDQTGLSARFIVVEQNLVQQAFPTQVDPNAIVAADRLKEALVRCYQVLAQIDEMKLWLSDEAFALFQSERKEMDVRKRLSDSAAERALANKVAGRLGRLAGMFHILWTLMGSKSLGKGGEVGPESMHRAIQFNRLLMDQTLGVRLTSADNSETAGMMLKLQRRAWEVKRPMTVGDLRKLFPSRSRPETNKVMLVLKELVERGYGELSEVEYRGQKGWRYEALKPLLEVGESHS